MWIKTPVESRSHYFTWFQEIQEIYENKFTAARWKEILGLSWEKSLDFTKATVCVSVPIFCSFLSLIFIWFNPPASKGTREVANLTERKQSTITNVQTKSKQRVNNYLAQHLNRTECSGHLFQHLGGDSTLWWSGCRANTNKSLNHQKKPFIMSKNLFVCLSVVIFCWESISQIFLL